MVDAGYKFSDKNCAVIFDQCNFEGKYLEICDNSKNF
jgi:hypothetical protein